MRKAHSDRLQKATGPDGYRRIVVWLLLVTIHACPAFSQQDKEEFKRLSFRERLFFGGNFGLMFGTITDIEISPVIGYRLTRNLSVGLGPKYEYFKDSRLNSYILNNNKVTYQTKTHIYGGRIYLQLHLIRNLDEIIPLGLNAGLFIHTEYEALSLENEDFRPWVSMEGRYTLHSVLAGGGMSLPMGERAALNLMVLWNLNETADSPYINPIIRFGFTF